ncbi:MAG: hypothetical protein DMF60_15390, partial [Acidobacteria bacterium]
MKCFAAATLSGLKITEGGRGTPIGQDIYLTAEPGSLSLATTAAFSELAGVVGRNAFLKADAVVHALADVPFDERLSAADQFIATFLQWVNDFLMALWLVKDNSVMCTDGYLLLIDPPHHGSGMVRHHLGIYYWHSQLDRERVLFTPEELLNAKGFMSEHIPRVGIPAEAGVAVAPTIPVDTPRLARAWYFAQNARMSADVSVKVATYVTCLEALLSTADGELTHRLAERVALMLSTETIEQRELFRLVKDAYDIRSKTLHGAPLGRRVKKLVPTASKCDAVVRRLFLTVLSSPKLVELFNKGDLATYFLDLLFG